MKKLIHDRWDIVEGLVRGKKVLDLGCVDHKAQNEALEHWLHRKICQTAADTLGVDYNETEVNRLRDKGYRITCGNVESMALKETFEVVVAGNLVEHLSNPGLFLDAVKQHLAPDGIFVLTTDNCYGLRSLRAIMLYDGIVPNQEHVLAFEEEVLKQLLERHGFSIKNFYYYNGPYANAFKKWIIDGLCTLRKSWAWQMLVIAENGGSSS